MALRAVPGRVLVRGCYFCALASAVMNDQLLIARDNQGQRAVHLHLGIRTNRRPFPQGEALAKISVVPQFEFSWRLPWKRMNLT